MAKQEVGLKIDVDVSSVGNMKQQLRAATNELVAMNEKFGSASKEATQAAQRVAKLKDAIGDAKALADTFNPDKKFVALGGAVQGAVAGFSALQGAMGLFADKNKEVEQLLLKVQSAMALQQGISGIAGSIDSFKLLAGTIKTQVVAAFTTLKGAMMATGIGLITSAIAFLVTNFESVKKVLYDTFPALKGLGDNMDRIKQIAMGVGNAIMQFLAAPISAIVKVIQGDFKGAFESLKNGVAFTKNFRAGEQKEIKDQADEREKIRQEELKKEQEANKKKLEEQKRAAAERLRKLQEQQEKERQLSLAADKVLDDARRSKLTEQQIAEEDAIRKFEESKKTLLAAGKKDFTAIEEQRESEIAAIRKKYKDAEDERLKKIEEDRIKKEQDELAKKTDRLLKDAENDALSFEERLAKIQERQALENQIVFASEEERKKFISENEIAITDIKNLEEEARIANAQFAADQLSAIAQLAGQDTAAGKALSVAAATISTYLSAQKAYESQFKPVAIVDSPVRGAIAAGVAIATGIANVKKILSVQVPGKGGAGKGGGGAAGISTAAPIAPQLATAVEATQVNTAAVNQMGNRAARAYVLNSDIQNENQRNAYIDRNASIGGS